MHPLALTAVLMAMVSAHSGGHELLLPPVHEVQRVAIERARIDMSEAASWRKKARHAAFVPKVQIDYGHSFKNDIDIDVNDNVYVGSSGVVVGPEEGAYSKARTLDHNFGFRAVWELGESVFSVKELAASAEARRVLQARNAIIADVAKHYYSVAGYVKEASLMERMKGAVKEPAVIDHKIFLRKVACEESLAALDGMTDGWFAAAIRGDACKG